MGALVDIGVTGPTAEADVRAVYGGLQLGCAAFLALSATRESWLRPGLAAQLSLYGGLASSRLLSYGLAGLPSALGLALHAGELAGVLFGALAWLSLRRSRPPAV
jgi:hypothetical protein